ncbi:MAG: spore germination protein [Butyricicoccus sp.]
MSSEAFQHYTTRLRTLLHTDRNFDSIGRVVSIGGRQAVFFLIDGFIKDELFEKILEFFYSIQPDDRAMAGADAFLVRAVPYCEAETCHDVEQAATAVLSGMTCLAVDGFDKLLLLDLRTYPQRENAEPEKDKVLRGSHDGFVETLVMNTALIRRRIRSSALRMEYYSIGTASHTDVCLCYMDDRVDRALLQKLQSILSHARVDSLTMNQESLCELLLPHRWLNPFPRFKFTERPDTAAAQVLEGDVVILVDNSPSVITLPTTIFDVLEEANDYYFPPVTGTYLRLVRFAVLILMLLLTPTWLLLLEHPGWVPDNLSFILLREAPSVPVFWQLVILELGIDGLKLATLGTPEKLSTSLSVVAGIVVGDFAVQSGWFSAEAMLYMAFVALGGFNQPSYELSYAMKFARLFLLAMTWLFGGWGYALALALIFLTMATTKTFSGTPYLDPLLPFRWSRLRDRLVRPRLRRY